jgi:CxxC-x17-CxxC domain-containing protein
MGFINNGGKRFEPRGKSSFGSKPGFVKKPWSGNYSDARSSDTPRARYKAICSKCGNSCEVPFKPVSGKPIFCRDCFIRTGDTAGGRAGDRFPRKDFHSRSAPSFSTPRVDDAGNSAILKQLEILNTKFDRLIKVIEESQKA